jgi:phosphoribosylaminoimidazole-succinocarboxamide synthase
MYVKGNLMYEGKSKKIWECLQSNDENTETNPKPEYVIVEFKDDITAGNGEKKDSIEGKGALSCRISCALFEHIRSKNREIPVHYIQKLSDTEMLCYKTEIFKLEVIGRNIITGSAAKRYNIKPGTVPIHSVYEMCYKDDALEDPFINGSMATAIGIVKEKELEDILKYTTETNICLVEYFANIGIKLVDFKLEFGKTESGQIYLIDEITPDTCRLWDSDGNSLDKDIYRRGSGDVKNAYAEVLQKIDIYQK